MTPGADVGRWTVVRVAAGRPRQPDRAGRVARRGQAHLRCRAVADLARHRAPPVVARRAGGAPDGEAALAGYALVDQASGDVGSSWTPACAAAAQAPLLLAAALAAGRRAALLGPAGDRSGRGTGRPVRAGAAATVAVADVDGGVERPGRRFVDVGGVAGLPTGFILRPLNVEGSAADVRALLRVNAAAFTELPDQGGWTRDDVEARMTAAWFRAEDVLLLVDGGTAAGRGRRVGRSPRRSAGGVPLDQSASRRFRRGVRVGNRPGVSGPRTESSATGGRVDHLAGAVPRSGCSPMPTTPRPSASTADSASRRAHRRAVRVVRLKRRVRAPHDWQGSKVSLFGWIWQG